LFLDCSFFLDVFKFNKKRNDSTKNEKKMIQSQPCAFCLEEGAAKIVHVNCGHMTLCWECATTIRKKRPNGKQLLETCLICSKVGPISRLSFQQPSSEIPKWFKFPTTNNNDEDDEKQLRITRTTTSTRGAGRSRRRRRITEETTIIVEETEIDENEEEIPTTTTTTTTTQQQNNNNNNQRVYAPIPIRFQSSSSPPSSSSSFSPFSLNQ
jgi:hypothetical protein